MSIKSKINSMITYTNNDKLGDQVVPESVNRNGTKVWMAIGARKLKPQFNIAYFPIYSLEEYNKETTNTSSDTTKQIGVYEINNTPANIYDVMAKYADGTDAPDIVDDAGNFKSVGNILFFPTSVLTPKSETKKAPLGVNPDWIAQYFNDGNYKIVTIPGDGNCFFFTIARALRSKLSLIQQRTTTVPPDVLKALDSVGGNEEEIARAVAGLKTADIDYTRQALNELNTVAALRIILSKLVTPHMLQSALERFNDILGIYPARVVQKSQQIEEQIKSIMDQIQKLDEIPQSKTKVETHVKLTQQLERLLDKQLSQPKSISKSYTNDRVTAAIELGVAEELLPFDNGAILTLEQYRSYILSSNFWANSWAISQLEYLLNIKTIIFEKNYVY